MTTTPETYLYGIEPVRQCLAANRRPLVELLLKDSARSKRMRELEHLARKANLQVRAASAHEIATLSGTRSHQGVALRCGPLPTLVLAEFIEQSGEHVTLVALDQVEDPQNVGGIIRTASFLGASAVLTMRDKSAPLGSTVSKASAGALEHLPIVQVGNLSEAIQALKSADFWAVGATGDEGIDFRKSQPRARQVLVMGNEGSGLRALTRKRCDELVSIPAGTAAKNDNLDSLNVNVATGILLSHFLAP